MRTIDADILEKAKFHPVPYTHIVPQDTDAESYKRGWNDAIDAIAECEPTVDAIEVIRCEKCKHWQEVDLHFHRSICLKNMCSFEENDYCSKAERRQDG